MSKLVYIDMDDVLCQYKEAHSEKLKQYPNMPYPQSQLGFFYNLQPISGAVESVKELIHSTKFDPYILTAPSIHNPGCYTEKRLWIERYFGLNFTKKLIISPNKGLLKGGALVDDHSHGAGQENFSGELILFRSERFPNWSAVIKHLKC